MSTFSLLNPTIWAHDQDLTQYLHQVSVKRTVDEKVRTNFASGGSVERIGGLRTTAMAAQGYWESVPDAAIFAGLGVTDRVVTISPRGAELEVAYIFQSGEFDYEQFGAVGEVVPFTVTSANTNGVGTIRGQLAKAKGNVSATGQLGSIVTLTGPTATQYLYAAFHVFSAGTTITVQVQSAALIGFGSPTTRATIGPITVAGGTWATRVAGPITDGFYRLNVSAVTGTFSVAGAIGIG